MKIAHCLVVTCLLTVVAHNRLATAATIVSDNFESYSDTAQLNAAWNEGTVGAGTLDTAAGNPGQSLHHPGGVTQKRTFAPTIASDTSPIVWQFDLYDDGVGNKRNTGGLRDNGGGGPLTALLEMGRYNSVWNPETAALVSGYGIRTAFLGGPADAAGWITFQGNPAPQIGWHTFTATIGSTNILWELDFFADGSIDASRNTPLSNGANRSYNVARFGGPSDVTSAGGAVKFDNLSVSQSTFIPATGGGDILYYVDNVAGTDQMAAALAALPPSYTVTYASSNADFATQIATNNFDLGILFQQGNFGPDYDAAFAALSTFVAGGGRGIADDWTQDNAHAAAFGATFTGGVNDSAITITDTALAAGLTNPVQLDNPGWSVFATDLGETTGISGGTFVNSGQSAIVVHNGGRTIFNGFLSDTFENSFDGLQFYTNEIQYVMATVPEPTTGALVAIGVMSTAVLTRGRVRRH